MSSETLMRQEVCETPAAVGRLLTHSRGDLKAAGEMLRTLDPRVVATIARGSSEHAATFLKYADRSR